MPERTQRRRSVRTVRGPSPAALDRLIDLALTDAHGDGEQAAAFHCLIDEHLALPIATVVLGAAVRGVGVDLTDRDVLVARCRRGKDRQVIDLLELPLPTPPPVGSEWIAAYRRWNGRR